MQTKPSLPIEAAMVEVPRMRATITKFEDTIWFGKVAEYIRASEYRGFKGQAGNLTVMMYRMLARVMITIQDQGSGEWVTLMVAENEPSEEDIKLMPMLKKHTMGLHMTSLRADMANEFINHAIDNWTTITNDPKVKLDILAAMQ